MSVPGVGVKIQHSVNTKMSEEDDEWDRRLTQCKKMTDKIQNMKEHSARITNGFSSPKHGSEEGNQSVSEMVSSLNAKSSDTRHERTKITWKYHLKKRQVISFHCNTSRQRTSLAE